MKKIVVEKPIVETKNGKTRWSCDISGDFINDKLYYEVEEKWGFALTDDRLDAAFVAMLPYVMYRSTKEEPIELILKAPISEKLHFQIMSELVPAMEKFCDWYDSFQLSCETIKNDYKGNAVLTGVSGGVDSFFTLIKSKREFPTPYKVTHGMFIGMADREDVNSVEYNNSQQICKELGLEFIYVESNVCGTIYESRHDAISTFAISSVPLVLGKLVKVYYHSSSHTYDEFKLDEEGISMADPLLNHMCSTETLSMYCCSMVATRAEKTAYISDDETVRKHLLACGFTVDDNGKTKNCSVCSKCTITMIDLDLAGRLDDFREVFDVDKYRKHPLYYWGYVFYKEKHGLYIDSTLGMAKKKGYKIPFGSRIMGLCKIIKHGFKRTNPYQHTFRP